MSCCRRSSGMSPRIIQQILAKFKEIYQIFPGTTYIAILSQEADVIVQDAQGKVPEELIGPLASVKKTALQFAATLNQMECNVIHIQGNSNLFSCYGINKLLLAFNSRIEMASNFNTATADEKMQRICEDLKLLLLNSLVIS